MKLFGNLAVILALTADTFALPKERVEEIDHEIKITFGWCRTYGTKDTCDSKELDHAKCYNFKNLDPFLDHNFEELNIFNGRCVIWDRDNCNGDHTGMIVGEHIYANNMCPRYNWEKKGSSIKCCGGDPAAEWCADPGEWPRCTGELLNP